MEDEIELSDYYYIIRKNLLLIIACFLLVFAGALAYTFTSHPVYEAKSLVLVTNQDQANYIMNQPAQRYDIQSQLAIIRSGAVLGQAYMQVSGPFETDATLIKDSNVIEISARSEDRFIAMQGANAVADSFVNYSLEARRSDAVSVMGFIGEQIDTYRAELDDLNRQSLAFKNKTKVTPDELFEEKSLEESISAKEKLYNYLLSKREEIGIVARQNSAYVRVIEYASMPVMPIRPNIPLNIALGIVLGGIIALGIAFGKEYIRNAYKTVKDVEADFGPTILGSLPETRTRRGAHKSNHYFFQMHNPQHKFTESLRMLRTNLMFLAKDKRVKLISVTSPERNDGKTTVAANLAMSLAKNGARVLLVDANIRNPVIRSLFRSSDKKYGFSDLITGDVRLQDVIAKTDEDSLQVIFAGTPNDYPAELLGSNSISAVMRDIRELPYDIILFDNTSLGFTESALMASASEGTILVLRHDKTTKSNALAAKAALEKARARMLGVVFNYVR